jgi:tetratricopeptide (TPR) repeat protein
MAAGAVVVFVQLPGNVPTEEVTFTRDVAPILYARCVSCHRPDGPAPFSLLTYGDAKQRATLIAAVTRQRYMPPWKPEPGYGDFIGARALTDREIDAIDRWASRGAIEGRAADLPAAPRWKGGWQLGTPDLVVTLPDYTLRPGGDNGADVFRNFVVPLPVTRARHVRGLEFRAGNRAVHHANIRIDRTPASRRLDDDDPAPGYEGVILRSADYPDGHFLGWTPGQIAPLAPPGLAWTLEPASDLVVQLHLKPDGKPERIQPAIGIYFTDEAPTRTPAILRLGRQSIDIAPGVSEYRITDSYVLPVDVEVHAVQPHAHYRARDVRAWADMPDGTRRWLIRVARWDFNWQDQYRYSAPFWLPAGTTIRTELVFDNSSENPRNPNRPPVRVSWGWRSSDEMGDVWVQVMTRTEADRARLSRDIRRKMAAEDAIGCEVLIAREPNHADLRNDAALLYMELGQPGRAAAHFNVVTRLRPQSAVARYNVGVALEAAGKSADAAREYEAALQLDPAYSLAHNNLGNVRLAEGRIADARRHYQRAVETGPDNAEAHNNLGGVLVGLGEIDAAVSHLKDALRLRPAYAEAHFNLARAYAAASRFDEAIREANEAQRSADGKPNLIEQIRQLIELCRQRK